MKDGGTGERGDECIGKGKGSFALSSGGGGGVLTIYTNHPSLRSWRYCVGARFLAAEPCSKKME